MRKERCLICKTELYKISRRKDTWLLYSMLFVPALYAIGLATGSDIVSYSGNGNITALNFMAAMFQMSQSMFIFNVILVAISGRTLGTEIEEKSLLLYVNRIGNRKKIYLGKAAALSIYSIIVDILLALTSLGFYYLVLNHTTEIVNGALFNGNWFSEVAQILATCGFWIMTILFTLLLSTKYKVVVCLGIYMIVYIAMNLLSYAKIIGYLSPLYYLTKFMNASKAAVADVVIFAIYLLIFAGIVNYAGVWRLEKKDL